ncbi:MAG: class I SAM-dependent methyltransferase [Planctomycetaceae bacterium]
MASPQLTPQPVDAETAQRFGSGPNRSSTPRSDHRRTPSSDERVSLLDRWLLNKLLQRVNCPSLAVRLWNGETVLAGDAAPDVTVVLPDRRTFRELIRDPFFQFGEAYSDGRLQIVGRSMVDFLRILDSAIDRGKATDQTGRKWWPLGRRRSRSNSLAASQQNIQHHYDIGNSFYREWLDRQLVYTCAYFEEPGTSLEAAQIAKMDHVCRKVWLQPGQTVIEAGCGWGAFALHMARYYGVTVRAYNISKEQVAYARQRAQDEGLQDRVEFIQDDWRTITGHCDVFVSVGMLEHVGRENYPKLGRTIRRSLNPGGRGLIHSIGQNRPQPFDRWIEQRVFPGAYPPTLAEMMNVFEDSRISVLDVENIRLHYAETLWHWLQRFERSTGRITRMFDERFVRMWRLYLAGSFVAFEDDRLQLYQVLFSPEKENGIPRNRRYQYDECGEPTRFDERIDPAR